MIKMTIIIIFAALIGLSIQQNTTIELHSNRTLPTAITTHAWNGTHPINATHHSFLHNNTLATKPHALNSTRASNSTHAPHTTQEPLVHKQFVFHYDPTAHKMLISSVPNCYIFTLSDQERKDVHADATMMILEAKLLLMIASSSKKEVPKALVDHHLQPLCGPGILHYYTFA